MRGAKGLEGAKRKVKTPFGTLTFDTSDDAFEPDVENKAGGRIKRQAGGKVRGVGQAIKGFGKSYLLRQNVLMAIDIDNSKINYDIVKPNREDYTDFKVYWSDLCYYLIQKYKDTYVKV